MAFLGFLWLPGDLPGGPGKNPDTGWMCTPMEVPNWRHRIGSCCVGCLRLECKAFSIWKAQQCGEERGASSNTLGVVAINFSGNSRVGSSRTPHSPLFPTRWLMSEHAAFPGSDLALHKTDPPPPPRQRALRSKWECGNVVGGRVGGGQVGDDRPWLMLPPSSRVVQGCHASLVDRLHLALSTVETRPSAN